MFNWFSKKNAASEASQPPETSGLGHVDATVPFLPAAGASGRPGSGGNAANRKTERLERRELLYAIVRESMTNAGMLSSSYKFKVLSLDSHGTRYLVMMDLPRHQANDTLRLSEIESQIARSAKAMYEIFVTAVYWRVNDSVTVGMPGRRKTDETPAKPVSVVEPTISNAGQGRPAYEPLSPEEILQFKIAAAQQPGNAPLSNGPEVRSKGRPAPPPAFPDTQIEDPPSLTISGSQYGDLI